MVFKKGESVSPKTQFKPGESGNPEGMPKGYKSFKKLLQEVSTEDIDYEDLSTKKKRMKVGKAMVTRLFQKALKGDVTAATAIMRYAEDQTPPPRGDEDNPVIVKIIREIVDPHDRPENTDT